MYKRLQREVSHFVPGQHHTVKTPASEDTSMHQHHYSRDQQATTSTPLGTPGPHQRASMHMNRKGSSQGADGHLALPMQLPPGMTAEEVNHAFEVVAATASAFRSSHKLQHPTTLRHQPSVLHEREASKAQEGGDSGGHGGHDAPNWSRAKSYSVLMGCTVLYAIIAGKSRFINSRIGSSSALDHQKFWWTSSMWCLMALAYPKNSSVLLSLLWYPIRLNL